MPDCFTKEERSRVMRSIPSSGTRPEIIARRGLHAAGLRFQRRPSELPGTPDLVLPRWRTVIFVHGCFWHRHRCLAGQSLPATRRDYWEAKFRRNVQRDRRVRRELIEDGWNVIVIWECELRTATRDRTVARVVRRVRGERSRSN